MIVVYLLMPIALILAIVFIVAFISMVRGGQFDDLDSPPLKMLLPDEPVSPAAAAGEKDKKDRI
jgi:cbb3-type cytochrome oxidase maturation protein